MTRLLALLTLCLLPGSPGMARTETDLQPVPATAEATLAGGCFWCLEEALEKIPGVISVISGYTGGSLKNPTYEQVSSGRTGHTEAVRVTFDSSRVTYSQILDAFWRNIDPLDAAGQFCDRGSQYRAGIFVHDEHQRRAAESSRQTIVARLRGQVSGTGSKPVPAPQTIVTEIVSAGPFYAAEEYHQDYYKKNPFQYRFYKFSCGRERRLEQVWGKEK